MYPYSLVFFLLACLLGIGWAATGNLWCEVGFTLFGVLFLLSVPVGAYLREQRLEEAAEEEESEEYLF